MVAAIYEVQMTHEQAEGVVAKALTVEDGLARLTLGVEPRARIVEVLELG